MSGRPTSTAAARWLYGQILLGSLVAISTGERAVAAPIALNVDTRVIQSPPGQENPHPAYAHLDTSTSPEPVHRLVSRAYRPYWYGSNNSGSSGPRGDWWKIVLGIAGGVILIAVIFYAVRLKRQRATVASHRARQSRSNPLETSGQIRHDLPPMHELGPSASRVNAWGYERPTTSTRNSQQRTELAPGTRGVSFSHCLTPNGVVSNGARSAGGFRSFNANNIGGTGGADTVQAPAPAYVRDAPADRVIAYGPPKYESAPTSPVNQTGGSIAGNRT